MLSEGTMQRKKQPQATSDKQQERGRVALDRRYGEIGISAVAAAVHCRGEIKQNADKQAEKQKDFALAFDRD
jgi:hypothetical protein